MVKKQVSRRDFIKGAALGAVSLASASIIGSEVIPVSAASITTEDDSYPNSADNDVKNIEDQLNYFDTNDNAGRADKGFDVNEFKKLKICSDMTSAMYNYFTFPTEDQANPAIAHYWESKGVTKVNYDLDDPERQWALYFSNGTYFEADENYKYPVVFCLHGGNNSILMTESYGWPELSGKEGFITVIPWAQGFEDGNLIIDEIPRIMEELQENYQIDESRIYVAGFSAGGRSATNVLMAFPELFAAGAIQSTSLLASAEEAEYENDYGIKSNFSYEDFERLTSSTMPLILYGGTWENCWPINMDPNWNRPVTTEDVNRWFNVTGAIFPEVTDESRQLIPANSGIGVERIFGLQFGIENVKIIEKQDTYCYIGSYYNGDDICTLRFLAVEGMPHWPLYCEAEIIWEFMTQFARDTITKELTYTNS